MKHTKKIAASLMAAVMTCSVFGASAGAVEFTVVGDNTSNTSTSQTQTVIVTSTVQDAVPEFFNGCVKFSWSPVQGAANYALKICNTDGTIVQSYYFTNKVTAAVVPETVFAVDYNSKKDFYACVVALKTGETDYSGTTFYAPASSKFTVESDMSKYPEYGAAQNIAFIVNDGKLKISWTNPNAFSTTKDIFSVVVLDSQNKNIFSKSITDTNIDVTGLKDGQNYTVKIINKTFNAISSKEFKFVSDVKSPTAGTNKDTTVQPQKGTKYTLPAPLTVKAKAGDQKITLSWSSVDEADGYRIFKYNAKTKKYETYKTVKGTKYTIKNLTNGTAYKFRIAAVRYDKKTKKYIPGTDSKTVTVTPKKPAKPVKNQ